MATGFSKSSVLKASDIVYEYTCSPCEENGYNSEALHFCKQCSKQFCDKCVQFHSGLYRNHTVLGHRNLQQWGKVKTVVAMEMCDEHDDEKLKMVCTDHNEMCCILCVSMKHRTCRSLQLIQDVAKGIHNKPEFKSLSADVTEMEKLLNQLNDKSGSNLKTLQNSYTKILSTIQGLRRKINQSLDKLEKDTVDEMNKILAKLNNTIQDDIDQYAHIQSNVKKSLADIQATGAHNESLAYIGFSKCQQNLNNGTQLLTDLTKPDYKIAFKPDTTIEQCISTLTRLGDFQTHPGPRQVGKMAKQGPTVNTDHIYTAKNKTTYPARVGSDTNICQIKGICQLSSGEIVIIDYTNKKLKLLNHVYTVIDHCDVPPSPYGICRIGDSDVAVAVNEASTTHEIHFASVRNKQVNMSRKFKVDHNCYYLAHHNGQLYVSTGYAIYIYTIAGRKMKKIYEDMPGGHFFTVRSLAISDDGKQLYITNMYTGQLISLDNQGKTMAVLSDLGLKYPTGVCVTDNGNVFICDSEFNTVIQVNAMGKKMATVIRSEDGLGEPMCVWFNRNTSQLIVGLQIDDNTVVFEMK